MHLFFILNRHASSLANTTPEAITREFGAILAATAPGTTAEFFIPESPVHLRTVLAERLLAGGVDRVVSCGGDGTLGEILPVMVRHANVPLAIVPMGTGNVLAINLDIPFDPPQALAVALGNCFRAVDIGRMGDPGAPEPETHLFILNASAGLDAEIMHQTDKLLKRRWGLLAYFIRGIPLLPSVRPSRLRIEADDRLIRTTAIAVTISNAGGKVPGGVTLHPGVMPDDGLLHGTIFKPKTALDYAYALFRLVFSLFGRHRRDVIRVFSARRIRIEAHPPLKTQADGNVIGTTPVLAEIIPTRLKLCVPVDSMG